MIWQLKMIPKQRISLLHRTLDNKMPSYTIKSQTGQPVTIQAASQDEALDKFLGTSAAPDVSEMGSFGRGLTSMLPMGDQAYSAIAGAAQNEPFLQERQEYAKE